MIGTIIGDIVGSRFEWNNIKTTEFTLFTKDCFPTDDTIMTLALAKAIMESSNDHTDLSEKTVASMQEEGHRYPGAGYGGRFSFWLCSADPQPYNSFGNGAAMRVSAAGFAGSTLEEVKFIAGEITKVTHNHPEGMKGAEATASAIYLARTGCSLNEIKDYINVNYYQMDFTLDEIRDKYSFDETCQGSVPQALMAFFESSGFEDAIRNAISIGGDSDTLAAICGGIAQAYYGVPDDIRKQAITYLDDHLLNILDEFEKRYL